MLQYDTVEPNTLAILKKLMAIEELSDFFLVGGTALALYYGHRKSIDIDLFVTGTFENESLARLLESHFPGFVYRNLNNPIGLFGAIDGVKVDLVKYHHRPMIGEPVIVNGIRLYSREDIMAMKVAAIMKRGVKKDFWDIAELLRYYSIDDFINQYSKKYPSQQLMISVPYALIYFEDAEDSEDPISLKGQTWDGVKSFIGQKVNDYLR